MKRSQMIGLSTLTAFTAILATTVPVEAQLFGRTAPGPDGSMTNVRAARIEFVKDAHDFGVIPDTGQVRCTFSFTNVGNDMLIISQIDSECGCTVPELDIRDYLPGESGTIEVRFDPKERPGKHHKNITVKSNDVSNPERKLGISVEVLQAVRLSTPSIALGRLVYGKGATGEVTLSSDRSVFNIKSVHIGGPHVTSEIVKREVAPDAAGKPVTSITVRFTVDPAAPKGILDRQITFMTELSDLDGKGTVEHMVRHHINGHIAGQLQVTPDRFTIGTLGPGEAFDREVRVYSLLDKPFNIVGVRIDSQSTARVEVSQEFIEVAANKIPVIRLQGTTPQEKGAFNGVVYLTTDIPDEKELEIRFFGVVRSIGRGPIIAPPGDGDGTATKPAGGAAAGDDR